MRFVLRVLAYASASAVVCCILVGVFATVWSRLDFTILHVAAMLLPLGGVVAAKAGASEAELTRGVRLVTATLIGLICAGTTLATYVIVMLLWGLEEVPQVTSQSNLPRPALPSLWILAAFVGGAYISYRTLAEPEPKE